MALGTPGVDGRGVHSENMVTRKIYRMRPSKQYYDRQSRWPKQRNSLLMNSFSAASKYINADIGGYAYRRELCLTVPPA